MSMTNRKKQRTLSVDPNGTVVVGIGREGVLNGGDAVGMTFDVTAHAGVAFTLAHAIRKVADGAWGDEGTDAFAGGAVASVDLTGAVGYEYRGTLSHDGAGPLDVPIAVVIEDAS